MIGQISIELKDDVQIVMLVTKAVSDQFGGGGISDRMIRFNGYPFLEKEDKEDGDHSFIEQSRSNRQ